VRRSAICVPALGPEIAQTRAEFSPHDVMEAHMALGQLYSYDGEMALAIAQFEAARRIAETDQPAAVADTIQSLGVAHLHKAEMDNGLYRAPGRSLSPLCARRHAAREDRGFPLSSWAIWCSRRCTSNHQPAQPQFISLTAEVAHG